MKKGKPPQRPSGQRSIASFMFKQAPTAKEQSAPAAPADQQTDGKFATDEVAATAANPETQTKAPPAKRARFFPPPADTATAAPAPSASQSQSVAKQPPAPKPDAHQRFQNKLVLGHGNRKHADSSTIVPQKHTPLELQVVDLKKRHPGVLLAIEVGYKFRFFGEDAEIAAKECNLFVYPDRNFMTASIPLPRLHVYVRRLVEAGHKVGIVRQTETAAIKAAGDNKNTPFQRRLAALYTQSTLEAGSLEDVGDTSQGTGKAGGEAGSGHAGNESLSRFMVCLVEAPDAAPPPGGKQGDSEFGVVAVETSTGAVLWDQFWDGMLRAGLEARLMYTAPSELLIAQPLSRPSASLLGSYSTASRRMRSESVPADKYRNGGALAAVTAFYGKGDQKTLDTAMNLPPLVLQALAHALDYLKAFNLEAVLRIGPAFRRLHSEHEMSLSPNTLSQLEVLRSSESGEERGSLLWLLDHTVTPMGGRLLRHWVAHPLRHAPTITARLDAVQELAAAGSTGGALASLGEALKGIPDLERGIMRLVHRTASPSEFLTVLQALASLPMRLRVEVEEVSSAEEPASVKGVDSALLQEHLASAASQEVAEHARDMLSAVDEEAAHENDMVQLFRSEGRFPDVTRCRLEVDASKDALQALLPPLRKQLRMPRLEYVSVQNQGDWMIEVPADRRDIPPDWEKVCSTKKTNRFHPPQVSAAMEALALATEHLQAAAKAAWAAFLSEFASLYLPFRSAVQALAALDALHSLAMVAQSHGYVRPEFVPSNGEPQLVIKAGRHPVLDAILDEPVVPNDTCLRGSQGPRAAIITGPNMGGKSCFIRQAALIALMAQVGSLVPAESARMHVLDAIFTRMGAADNLARGRSTFLEELSETSAILEKATDRSLVIVDELGRGTATHDGVAIAHATLQHLITSTRCLTLFVTHYPKVASLQEALPGMVSTFFMSYIQEDESLPDHSSGPQPMQTDQLQNRMLPRTDAAVTVTQATGSPIRKLAMHTTASSAVAGPSPGSSNKEEQLHVPKIAFLYKLAEGVADRSFGLNVARMAQLPASVVERASQQAASFEASTMELVRAAERRQASQAPATQQQLCPFGASKGRCAKTTALSLAAQRLSELH
ncbi:hypothetical protein WJX73_002195 [Symbiochloris irregularis]|uniref:DNA mismatch repair protein n=1 Tax=Symbiochloris irregularis TaxID=706552 RepID=A0AAW1Q2B5_9CHLO